MNKRLRGAVYTALFLFLSLQVKSEYKDWPLSNSAALSLITCGVGDELPTAFGHSGLRVLDSVYQIDVIFNYGSYNYTPSQFYYHFIKGDPTFYVTIEPTQQFLSKYNDENRIVQQNTLLLDSVQRHSIFNFLMWNADEANYAYQYDLLYNNCATKLRDVLVEHNVPVACNTKDKHTFRGLLNEKLETHPWSMLGLYIILGSNTDKDITGYEMLFMPDRLQQAMLQLNILSNTTTLANSNTINSDANGYIPFLVISFILCIPLLLLAYNNRKIHYALILGLLFITGSIGLALLGLQFYSSSTHAHANYNLLWAMPLNLLACVVLAYNRAIVVRYAALYGIYLVAITIAYFFIPQQMYYGFYIWGPLVGCYLFFAFRKLSYQH